MNYWNSLETLQRLGNILNWSVAILTALSAVAGIAAMRVANRVNVLQEEQGTSLKGTIDRLTLDLDEAKKLASPVQLTYLAHEITKTKDHMTTTIQFQPDKNQALGLIEFNVKVVEPTGNVKIKKIWPSLKGGAFSTGDGSAKIDEDGISANLNYSLLGHGFPTFDVELTRECQLDICGNYLQQSILIDVRGDLNVAG
jgi:hypothetical protein